MGFKEFMESFKKKYRNADLYMLFDKKEGKTIDERIRKNKKYFCIVIKNNEGNKIKVIGGGKVLDIEKVCFEALYYSCKTVRICGKPYCLVPLEKLTVGRRDDKIKFNFGVDGDVLPGHLDIFCDIGCLCHKYVSEGSLVSDVLLKNEKFEVLSEHQIISVEKFLNETIHNQLIEIQQHEKEQKIKDEKLKKERLKKQAYEEQLDKERDF